MTFKPKTEPLFSKKPCIFPLALAHELNNALDTEVERLKGLGQKITKQALIRQMIEHCLKDIEKEQENDLRP